ncbi:nucleotide disphospho-sugar-binding domain-containing protein [Umezawaea sp. Da 62-37]|uniref:nucleotide disphospho-sugar-binding domain-containing protein n=1 Tax=Umezawaea sp. Da 62-37 TaxID=3075927 RepID=UPI0028F72564|nr:nucleotide disphospho-sugar-binding domain-containing protein [Umezawaea sp. Da 62-37]WNV85606.1 glycosyltransferase [Umezawaea sp. Da 62-37]
MAKIIVAAPPIPGELAPLLQLGVDLAARGHRITVLTGSRFRSAVENAGLAFVPLSGAADYDIAEHAVMPERLAAAPGPEQLNIDWINAFVNPMPDQHTALQELLAEDPDQYLLCNVLFLGMLPPVMGVPGRKPLRWVGVSAVVMALSSDDTTFFGPVPVGPGEDQVAANRAANAGFTAAMCPTQERMDQLLRELGATEPTPSFVDAVAVLPDETAVLTVPGFEFARGDLPANIHLVGIQPTRSAPDWQPPDWWSELDGSRPVVVVTQGTLANHDFTQLVEPALTALADLDVTVVAALGRPASALSIPIPANARVAEFIPFDRLLPKASVYISNGGIGGLQQALAAGVPVVVAGETEDKPANAARVKYHGLGIDLATATPTPEAIAAATASLLEDSTTAGNVERIAKVYAEHDALTEIEHLLLR